MTFPASCFRLRLQGHQLTCRTLAAVQKNSTQRWCTFFVKSTISAHFIDVYPNEHCFLLLFYRSNLNFLLCTLLHAAFSYLCPSFYVCSSVWSRTLEAWWKLRKVKTVCNEIFSETSNISEDIFPYVVFFLYERYIIIEAGQLFPSKLYLKRSILKDTK